MADLRLLVAIALNSSDLSHSDLRETDIDRIGALAFADDLGVALLATKWASDWRAYWRANDLLVHRTKRHCADFRMRKVICRTALLEWLDDSCTVCGGRGSLAATNISPARQCHICDGSGKRKISELWRAAQLGVDVTVYQKWEPRYNAVQRRIVDAETQARHDIARQLGRVRG